MPELPEVETMRRGISPVVGCRIAKVKFPRCRLKPISVKPSRDQLRRQLPGCEIQSVDRIGKRIVLRLSSERSMIIEPRMTGLVLLSDPPNSAHLRLGLRLESETTPWLWFWDRRGLGTLQLLSNQQLKIRLGPAHLGPDALSISAKDLHERLQASRREIKVALLDQKAIAGIGNLYASEILHVAKIHPQQRCDQLTKNQYKKIQIAIREVLNEAIHYEGSTLSDGTYRNALNQTGSYQNHHRVYNLADQLCPRCKTQPINRIVQAQRSTFFCDKCQNRRP
ncbi:MAG: bifunctional DNA-formamidopyrimidine glycosylase/DNA-(apurinic or apyrimidinic site) lyase [Planctomycetaceae bacterium]|nr:bifunctional DNA-formamidopyrimidine glycosylase/DNA-(apurinic or apyrimidinic site) lyase [Planctomycetaceae bacterium]